MGTSVTEQSWFSRIGGAFKGILFGGLLTVVSVPILFWNEGRAVRTAKGLQEGANVVVDINPDSIDPANDGKFVHATGATLTEEVLRDEEFSLQYEGIRLTRHVEMYQWKENEKTETKKNVGGSTTTTKTFSYEKDWYPDLIDSRRFDETESHRNPPEVVFADQSRQAKDVSLGQFRLPESLISMIAGQEIVELDDNNVPARYRDRATIRRDGPNGSPRIYISATGPTSVFTTDRTVADEPIENEVPADPSTPGLIDLGQAAAAARLVEPNDTQPKPSANSNASNRFNTDEAVAPQIGDVRIHFTATPPQTVSLLSQQSGDSFRPYKTQYGTTIHKLNVGVLSAAEMIAQEEAANRMLTWLLRIVGAGIMFFGLTLVLRPLSVLVDVLPIAGSLVGFGTSIIAGLLTIAGSMTVIGIAWLFYRPLLGISLLVLAIAAILLILKRGRSKAASIPETLTSADLA